MDLPPQPFIVDTHQDLGYHCQEYGRELDDPMGVTCMITLPWLLESGVRLVCATLFTPPGRPDSERRFRLHSQYNMYCEWFSRFRDRFWLIRNRGDLEMLAEAAPLPEGDGDTYPVGVIILMEGCDLLETPHEMRTWFDRGVRMAGLTWNGNNRFASGVFGDGKELKELGLELVAELDRLGMILDLAHLNDQGIDQALEVFTGPVCSSHTNARTICANERNHSDRHLSIIAQRQGIIGINLLAPLVIRGWRRGDRLPVIREATEHTRYIANLVGKMHVGIGSDLDGGLTPENTPQGIDSITDLHKLGEDLAECGWNRGEIARFNGINWWEFFARSLPRS